MDVKKFPISEVLLIEPKIHSDDRGYFCERYNKSTFHSIGLKNEFIQDNFSVSKPSVLRGIHYRWNKPQGKLITCLKGRIFDVAVDLRKDSATFGQHVSVELSGDRPQWFWVPPWFGHGFCVLGSEEAHIMYKVDQSFDSEGERGIQWNDPDLGIKWPGKNFLIHPKDVQQKTLQEYKRE